MTRTDYSKIICRHYDIPYTARTCPRCGAVYHACPVCRVYDWCDPCIRLASRLARPHDPVLGLTVRRMEADELREWESGE